MSENPKSPWKQPMSGSRKWLGWAAILIVVAIVAVFAVQINAPHQFSAGELILVSVIVAAICLALVLFLIWFVRWLRSWRNFRRFLFGVACFITLIALFYAEENWRGKRAWEKHRQALVAAGEKFSMTDLMPPPIPDELNFAMTPLLRPMMEFTRETNGVVWKDTNALARMVQLGINLGRSHAQKEVSLGILEKGTFTDIAAWAEFYRGNTNYPQADANATDAQTILVALGKFDTELKELHEAAAHRPLSRFPIEYQFEPAWGILLPHLAHLKVLNTLTAMRAISNLQAGHAEEAFNDLNLGFRISGSISNEPILIDHLVRIASVGINLQTLREGLVRHAWNDAQLAQIEKQLASMDLLVECKLAMRGERVLSTGGLDWLRRQGFGVNVGDFIEGGSRRGGIFNLMPSGWFYQNMVTISSMEQQYVIAAVDGKSHRVFPDVCNAYLSSISSMPSTPYNVFAQMLLPALDKAAQRTARMQFFVDAARLGCAIERFRMATGGLPENLNALAPQFIEKIPTDLIDGNPLRYERDSDGDYKIYSVGWNKSDEHGEIVWTEEKHPGVDFAKGDWVWQMPARLP